MALKDFDYRKKLRVSGVALLHRGLDQNEINAPVSQGTFGPAQDFEFVSLGINLQKIHTKDAFAIHYSINRSHIHCLMECCIPRSHDIVQTVSLTIALECDNNIADATAQRGLNAFDVGPLFDSTTIHQCLIVGGDRLKSQHSRIREVLEHLLDSLSSMGAYVENSVQSLPPVPMP